MIRLSRRLRSRNGTTLVELIVAMVVLAVILNMVVGILSPAAKLFLKMQRLQRAEAILDTIVLQLQDIAGQATGYVKIYPEGTGEDVTRIEGAEKGTMLEFINPEGFVTLVSAGGCPETAIVVGGQEVGDKAQPVDPGQLLVRYYAKTSSDTDFDPVTGKRIYRYQCRQGGSPAARAVLGVFPSGFYMGNRLELSFSYGGVTDDALENLLAEVSLYEVDKAGNKTLLVQEKDLRLDLRYAAVKNDGITAVEPTVGP